MSQPQHSPSRHDSDHLSQTRSSSRMADTMARSAALPPRMRNEESWVEIASQPSSSSLSSIGDDIITTGLRVQHDSNTRRRRRTQPDLPSHPHLESRNTGTSSQEEYEESESEEDHVMTSSNEHVTLPSQRIPSVSRPEYDAGSESDDDHNTALGQRTDSREPAFTPQPNAFSHPPSSARPVAGSYFPAQRRGSVHERPSYLSRNSRQHSSYNHAADHDAALRASLTTLLSIGAAAARGLPKRNQNGIAGTTISSNEPMGLRFMPESEIGGGVLPRANTSRPLSPSTRARSSPSVSSQEDVEKGKRKATATKPSGEKARALKKKRTQLGEEAMLSPTLLTWVMSAGVVVLVSVVGFGAGYVIGREVGRQEAMAGLNGSSLSGGGSCGREAVRGSTGTLRKFKWGMGGAKAIVA